MSSVNTCAHCNKLLVNKRSHARACNSVCRNAAWRTAQARPVSIKVAVSKLQFNKLKSDADDLGLLVNQLMLDRAITPFTNVGATL